MVNFSAPFIKRPIMTFYVMLVILIGGYLAFTKLPVNDLPNIEYPMIMVRTQYSSATPDTIAQTVTTPMERELNGIEGLKEISSVSGHGESVVMLKFHFDKDITEAVHEVQVALDRVQGKLPKEIDSRPTYTKLGASNTEHIIYMIMTASTYNIGEIRNYAEMYVKKRLERIPGVANVDIFGAPSSIRIQINPDLMAARGIGIDTILDIVKKHNENNPLGTIETEAKTMTLELEGDLKNAKDFEELVIADGPVLLKDVSRVIAGEDSRQKFYFSTPDASTEALIIGISKQGKANSVEISRAVSEQLKNIAHDLPPSIQLDHWFDKALWIKESVTDVSWSLFFAFLLVGIVIYLSLGRLSEALIPSLALPMSLVGTFIAMYALNFSLDILSLLALTLSVGFVVDDAIVVLENIVRHQEKGSSPIEASLNGSQQIGFTVLSMTLSLVAVFIPLLFMEGMNGLLFREFSITLAVAILISGFISLTLTPMLCSRFLSHRGNETRLQAAVRRGNEKMVGWYRSSLIWCIDHPKTIFGVTILSFALTIPLFSKLPVQLFPNEDRGFIHSFMVLPTGASDAVVEEYQEKVVTVSRSNPYIKKALTLRWGAHLVAFMELIDLPLRPEQPIVIQQIQKELDAIPGIHAFTGGMQLINMNMEKGDNGYTFSLQGIDKEMVEEAASKLQIALSASPNITSARLGQRNDAPKLSIALRKEQAQQLGIDKNQVQKLLQHVYGEVNIGHILKNSLEEKIYVELAPEYKGKLSSLDRLYLGGGVANKGMSNGLIPLKAVATWREELDTPTVQRINQFHATNVNYVLKPEVAPNEGLLMVKEIAEEVLPATVMGNHAGMAEVISETSNAALLLLLMAFFVMYIILGILYESLIHPLTILSALPFACLGGVLTLLLFNEPLSIYSIVGFLLLIGIVKKNGIMMVDYAVEAQKSRHLAAKEAIIEGSLVRFRPITMTTVAAIMGALPIAIGFGDGAETRRGLGMVIAGGLIFSQLLTLYVTPVIFLALERLKTKALKTLRTSKTRTKTSS